MKIQLAQTSIHCPNRLTCIACEQTFAVGSLRSLLHNDQSLLQGDLCPTCSQSKPLTLQNSLQAHGTKLLCGHLNDQERGRELLALAQEPVQYPSLWQWLSKKIEILAAETNALEQARYDIKPQACSCRQIQSLEYMYQESSNR